jgi:HK97 family phage portal protein
VRLWPSIGRDPRPRTEVKDAVTRRHSAGPNYQFAGVPLSAPMGTLDVERAVDDAWGRVVWVYKAIDARAKNASRLTVRVNDGRGPGATEIEGHRLSTLLNRRANRYETGQSFRYRLHTLMDLSKMGVFVEVVENRGGQLAELHLLHPKYMFPIPDPDTFVSGFEMRLPSGEIFGNLPPYKRGKGGVLWIRRPHPTDPYSSSTWLDAAGISIDIDHYARVYNRNFLRNDGRPGGVLMVQSEDGIDEGDAAVLQARMSGGVGAAGKVTIMEADGLEYVDLSTTPRDAQYVESRALTKGEILAAAGTPESLWNASGRTFDNADAELESFWRNEMVPEVEAVASFWEELTEGGIEDDHEVVTYAYEEIEVLQREIRMREKRLADEQQMGLISVDEYRDGTGKDPLDLPGTRVLWLTAGKAPVGTPEDVNAILNQGTPTQEPPPPDGGAPQGGGTETPPAGPPPGAGPPDAATGGQPPTPDAGQAPDGTSITDRILAAAETKAARGADPFDTQRTVHAALINRWEEALAAELASLFHKQQQVVLARLGGAKARRHTRHWVSEGSTPTHELKALNSEYIVDRRRWIDEVVAAIGDIVKAAFGAFGAFTVASLGADDKFDGGKKEAEIVAKTVRVIAEGFDARAGRLQQVIADADKAGKNVEEIAADVKEAFQSADTWAQVASRQVVGAMNGAALIGATQAGAVKKRWLATDDERTRPTHREAEGQVRDLDEKFDVGAAELAFPGDPTGLVGEWINCRCTMLFQTAARDFDHELDVDLADLDAYEKGLEGKMVDPFTFAQQQWAAGAVDNPTVRYFADKYGWAAS